MKKQQMELVTPHGETMKIQTVSVGLTHHYVQVTDPDGGKIYKDFKTPEQAKREFFAQIGKYIFNGWKPKE